MKATRESQLTKQGNRVVALYMNEQLKCMEFIYGRDDRLGESLQVVRRGQ